MDDRGSRVRFPARVGLAVKRPGREADHSPPSSAKVTECVELCLHSPNKPSWRGAQFKKKAQGQLYLLPFPVRQFMIQSKVNVSLGHGDVRNS
jgi:hypothetical protein